MKYFWAIMVGLLVVLSLASFAEQYYVREHASEAARAKCVNEPGWYYRTKYINCLRRNA